MYVCMYIPAA